jgi:hypothetical protein
MGGVSGVSCDSVMGREPGQVSITKCSDAKCDAVEEVAPRDAAIHPQLAVKFRIAHEISESYRHYYKSARLEKHLPHVKNTKIDDRKSYRVGKA